MLVSLIPSLDYDFCKRSNKYGFTSKKLEFEVDLKYFGKQNRTPKAKITKELLNIKILMKMK
ncbi:hypothetical protein PKHYL_19940 [Psychrobacter sp. KH172YL61]|nr:hypothetical protein PKHYL_19940 [Psychrobacter sp. KH172YL61]